MKEYFKFPSTPYIVLPEECIRKDKVLPLDELEELLCHEIIIEEKIDGANLGISFDDEGNLLLQNRGSWLTTPFTGQWKIMEDWIGKRKERLFDFLLNKYILFGEWCYATHSIYYDKLPDYFIGFDLYDKKQQKFLSVYKRNELLIEMGLSVIKQYARGVFQLNELPQFFSKSAYGDNLCEGIYIRWDEDEWLKKRAKLVRNDFRQKIDGHWSSQILKKNDVKYYL